MEGYDISCSDSSCVSNTFGYGTAQQAEDAWNTRAPNRDEDTSYEIVQDDMVVAGCSGPDAEQQITHYAAQYLQDGPIEVFKVVRTPVTVGGRK